MQLKVITARNSLLMGISTFASRPINLVVSIILARLLDPRDFGLVALVLILVQSTNLFTTLGLDKAIIYSQEDRRKLAFHSFVIETLFGLVFFLLIQMNSTWLAQWLGDVATEPILLWLNSWMLMSSLGLVPYSLLRKDLQFQKIAAISVISDAIYMVIVIGLAYTGFGVWSLVYANLIKVAYINIMYWVSCPGWDWLKPCRWEWSFTFELLRFGSEVAVSGLLAYVHTNWDDWFVGRTLGVQQLGFYNKSYDFSNSTIGKLIRNTIGTVFLPSYAKMQGDHQRLQRAYIKSMRMVFLLIVPIAFGMFAVAGPLVIVAFGDKWAPMIPVLQIFALLILTRPISENTSPLFQAVGAPRNNVYASIVLLVVMVPGVLLLKGWGIAGIAFAVGASHFVGALYNIYQVERVLPGSAKVTLQTAFPIWGIGLLMVLCVELAKVPVAEMFGSLFTVLSLLTLVATGMVVYLVALALTQRELITEIWQIGMVLLPKRLPLVKSRV